MHGLDFEYFVPRIADEPEASIDFPYGNDDVAFARRYPATVHRVVGGGVVDLAKPAPLPPPSRGRKPGGTPAWKKALAGRGAPVVFSLPGGAQAKFLVGGCSAEGVRSVFGPRVKRWVVVSNVVAFLDGEVARRVQEDPAYKGVLAEWRDCVEEAGYTPDGPDSRALTADPTDRRANVVNARCGAQAGVVRTAEELERRIRTQVNQEHEAAIIDYNALVADAQSRIAARS